MLGKSLKFLSIFFMASVLILSTAPSLMAGGGWEPLPPSGLAGTILSAKLEVIVLEDHALPSGVFCTCTQLDPNSPCVTECSSGLGIYGTDTRIVTVPQRGKEKEKFFYDSLVATLTDPEQELMDTVPEDIIGIIPSEFSCIAQQIHATYGHYPEVVEAVITEKIDGRGVNTCPSILRADIEILLLPGG